MLRADSSSCVGLGDIIALLSLPPPEIWVKGADEIPLTPPPYPSERDGLSPFGRSLGSEGERESRPVPLSGEAIGRCPACSKWKAWMPARPLRYVRIPPWRLRTLGCRLLCRPIPSRQMLLSSFKEHDLCSSLAVKSSIMIILFVVHLPCVVLCSCSVHLSTHPSEAGEGCGEVRVIMIPFF